MPLAAVYISLFLIGALCGAVANATPKPNVLLIYVDDLGYGDLGSHGHPVIQTPNLDRLAMSGVRLTNYYSPSPLCSPSRAALLTGRHPYRSGIQNWIPQDSGVFLENGEITLAEILQNNGYATALIGKWHLNSDLASPMQPQPNDQGFDYFYGHNAFQIPTNKDPVNIFRDKTALGTQAGYTAQLYADEAIAWLETAQKSAFFLMLSMAEPHTTFENPPAYNAMYADFTTGDIVPIPSGLAEVPKHKLKPRGPGEYYANVTYMDAQIGRVLGWLDDHAELRDNTIVVFASDNGPVTEQWINWWEVNAYGSTAGLRGRKHFLYEGGLKVPAIVRYPEVLDAGINSDALITGTDWFSTIAAWTHTTLPTDRKIDGTDVGPSLNGKTLADRDLLWALPSDSPLEYAFRRGDWKLMFNAARQPQELYNLSEDPLELFNLFDPAHKKVKTMTAAFTLAIQDIDRDAQR